MVVGALVVGSSHNLMIRTELPLMDAPLSGSVKPVVRLAVVDQPSCELSAARIAALRHGTDGRANVPSAGSVGSNRLNRKYRSVG